MKRAPRRSPAMPRYSGDDYYDPIAANKLMSSKVSIDIFHANVCDKIASPQVPGESRNSRLLRAFATSWQLMQYETRPDGTKCECHMPACVEIPGRWPGLKGRMVTGAEAALSLLIMLVAAPAFAQTPSFQSDQLIRLVAPVALYPDPLLAQVLAAATFSDKLPAAARWADQHRKLIGEPLAQAMRADPLPWNPTVQALLPFPSVLDAMTSDMNRSGQLGNAFLVQQNDVLSAIQGERAKAKQLGYLKSNKAVSVGSLPQIEIMPVDRAEIAVPSYDPGIVFSVPPKGSPVADAIRFDTRVEVGGFQLAEWKTAKFQFIGGYFQAWGWGFGGIDWSKRTVIINGRPWQRNWTNRTDYVHPYPELTRIPPHE